jgi:hypothetical protein
MTTTVDTAVDIHPFTAEFAAEALDDLRRRISATRWPTRELVADRSQGVQLATAQELARYWATDYDLRRVETQLNALPQFTTEIDGVDIHFIHVRSRHDDALPLIMTHGWPGSVVELLGSIGPLTDPTAHGGRAEDAFHLVLPSLPGYGFSSEPEEVGWDVGRIGKAWAELMRRLGYSRYVAQGGDVGAAVTDVMGRQAPAALLAIHVNLLRTALGSTDGLPAASEQERAALAAVATFNASGRGYFLEQATRPQTIGYGLLDSPVALAAWMLDHDTDAYYKVAGAFLDGRPSGELTRDRILDNVTLYWLTGTGASAARLYWENGRAAAAAAGQAPPPVRIPVGFTTFPGEIVPVPRSWVEATYPTLAYFNQVDRGGHFAAWEEPELFASELRKAFGPLRGPGCVAARPNGVPSRRRFGHVREVLLELPEGVEVLACPDQVERRPQLAAVAAGQCVPHAVVHPSPALCVAVVRRRHRRAVEEGVTQGHVPRPDGVHLGVEVGPAGPEPVVAVRHLGQRGERVGGPPEARRAGDERGDPCRHATPRSSFCDRLAEGVLEAVRRRRRGCGCRVGCRSTPPLDQLPFGGDDVVGAARVGGRKVLS